MDSAWLYLITWIVGPLVFGGVVFVLSATFWRWTTPADKGRCGGLAAASAGAWYVVAYALTFGWDADAFLILGTFVLAVPAAYFMTKWSVQVLAALNAHSIQGPAPEGGGLTRQDAVVLVAALVVVVAAAMWAVWNSIGR